jgi:propionyl-CoA synthetase
VSRIYDDIYRRSLDEPDAFWGEAAEAIAWDRRWDRVLDGDRPPFYRWFAGGRLNTCRNALDRHVDAGLGGRLALIHDSPVTGTVRRITYAELRARTAEAAGALRALGVGPGDRIVIYMPMVPEAVVAMLACARLGAVHSVVFGGFAAPELAARIDDCAPKLVVSASCGIEGGRVLPYKPLLDAALRLARHGVPATLIRQRPQVRADLSPGRDHDWDEALAAATPADCVPVAATDPLYILYTSGTTGRPKGIVRDTGGHAVAMVWTMANLYGIKPGEVFWTASDVGWVVGHSYIVYAPLLAGCTTVLYEGKPVGTPDAGAFWRVAADHGVVGLFTAPTALRAIRREDPEARLMAGHDLSRLRALFLAGERSDPETLRWAEAKLGVPTNDHWWQTETGWAIAGNPFGIDPLPVKHGSATRPMPGWNLRVLGPDREPVPPGVSGALACRLPLPPSATPTIWQGEERFRETYLTEFPGYYNTGDAGYIDGDGYVFVMGRVDDVINVAGHRLSTGHMEEVLVTHDCVAECAVVGVADALKGQVPVGFLVLKAGITRPHAEIAAEAVALIRDRIGPVAAFKTALVVERLPKTRSGKILRGTMAAIADGRAFTAPPTIDEPATLEGVGMVLHKAGFPAAPVPDAAATAR